MPLWLDLPVVGNSGLFTITPALFLAYLDPGSGSYALQILLATMFGGMFALKQSWSELKIWLAARFGESISTPPPPSRTPTLIRPNDIARPGIHGHSTAKVQ